MNCTGKRCIVQYGKVDPATCQCVSYCPQATPPKTNADFIRSMSDEELADYLRWHNDLYSRYEMDWLDWLKKEVEE